MEKPQFQRQVLPLDSSGRCRGTARPSPGLQALTSCDAHSEPLWNLMLVYCVLLTGRAAQAVGCVLSTHPDASHQTACILSPVFRPPWAPVKGVPPGVSLQQTLTPAPGMLKCTAAGCFAFAVHTAQPPPAGALCSSTGLNRGNALWLPAPSHTLLYIPQWPGEGSAGWGSSVCS